MRWYARRTFCISGLGARAHTRTHALAHTHTYTRQHARICTYYVYPTGGYNIIYFMCARVEKRYHARFDAMAYLCILYRSIHTCVIIFFIRRHSRRRARFLFFFFRLVLPSTAAARIHTRVLSCESHGANGG